MRMLRTLLLVIAPCAALAQRPDPRVERAPLLPVQAVVAKQTGSTEITVSWPKTDGVVGYFIGRLAPPNGWGRLYPAHPLDTTYVDRKVEAGRRYTYAVRADYGASRVSRMTTSDTVIVDESYVAVGGGGAMADSARETPVESRDVIAQRAYRAGRSANLRWWLEGERLHQQPWLRAAAASDFPEEELVSRWKEIGVAAILYSHILKREPTGNELRTQVNALVGGKPWRDIWRELAQSSEREQRFGAWAGAPMTLDQARRTFNWAVPRTGEQCFGGLGPACSGGVPEIYGWVQPRWHDYFTMPDGTRMASVELGVAVGSILHDNACMDAPQGTGIACQGWEPVTDLTKHAGVPAAMEWNKASWNVIDGRGWRTVFGPYPVDATQRRSWYDDLRPVPARRAMMAKPLGPLVLPILDQPYRGRERRASRMLEAPTGARLDGTDGAFCKRKQFKDTQAPIGKAPLGICW
ncbi:MAG TPA: fibronectin type III domain-containing protein [Gemmatimonadaceae bacterium]